ncbi:MAG TPA: hypothetical protein VGF80_05605 [Galbitalea sp.]|jgi:hypothetical protein
MKIGGLVGALALLLLVTGCTQSPPTPTPAHSTKPRTVSTPSATLTTSASPYISDAASTYTVTDGDDVQVSWLAPSRNIACGIVLSGASAHVWGCSVKDHTWVAPSANPADICYNSGEDCGTGIEALGSGKLRGRGETVFESQRAIDGPFPAPAIQTLAYGHSVTADGVTCVSLETGMTCTNITSGHGFTLSKSTYSTH